MKTAKIMRGKHPRNIFFYHHVFFGGLEAGLLLSFKTWLLKEVVVADIVTLSFGSLVLTPDHCLERNTNLWGQNIQLGTTLELHEGPVLVPKQNNTQNPTL